ncbi:MAG: sulfopyruvate decarboxylase subunit beta [Methanotrichaceae archaeon]|nr:sulfopyruvate decarboxylase subunit beta [Methanotrichaceae archaeon]
MKRIEAITIIAEIAQSQGALLVSNIGFPSRELYAMKDRPENFYMLGSMGLASSIGLGLALAQKKKKVIVVEGDGSVLMNLGTLATIANYAPDNYLLIILDNCCYGSTGQQPTCTSNKTDLAEIAKAAGTENVLKVSDPQGLKQGLSEKAVIIVARVDPGNADVPIIDRTPEQIIQRFRTIFVPLRELS